MNKIYTHIFAATPLSADLKKSNRIFFYFVGLSGLMKKAFSILLLLGMLFFTGNVFGQTTIVSDGLNNSTSLFTLSGGAYYTGNSISGDRPTLSPFASEGTHSRGVSNGTATLTSSDINTSGYTGISLEFSLAAFSIGSTGNGLDGTDIVTVEISPDGGTNWYSTLRVLGNSNAFWAYSATGVASTAYDGDATPVDFTPYGGGQRNTDGYSTVTITGLPASTKMKIRVTLFNNASAETWLVDDFVVKGTLASGKTVTFDGNGKDGGSMSPQIASVATALTKNTFTKTGYTFAGWNTIADGSGTAYADEDSYDFSADITLYAQWNVSAAPCHTENFSAIGTTNSYGTRTWSGTGGTWTATDAREDQTINGKAITIRNGIVTSPTFNDGISSITLTAKFPYVESSGNLVVKVNGTTVGTVLYSDMSGTTPITKTFTGINITGNIIITLTSAGGARYCIDDLNWTCNTCTPPTQATTFSSSSLTINSGTANWTRGLGDKVLVVAREGSAVNADPASGTAYTANATFGSGTEIGTGNFVVYNGTGTSVNVTGLTAGTTYYFAVYEYFTTDVCYNKTALTGDFTTTAPTITLSSPSPAVAAANITAGTTNNVIYRFDLAATGAATLTGVTINTSGTYAAGNISNFKCWYSADATFSAGTDILLSTKSSTLGAGAHIFPSFTNRLIANGATGYFFITTDVPCNSTNGNTIIVNAITTSNLTFVSGTKTGSANAGGTQTIISATPNNVTGAATSVCSNGSATVSWTTPAGCSSNFLVFAKAAGTFSATPSGNGISYTANTVFGSGTAFDGGFCVYKGTGNSVTITGLTNGTNYTFTIFNRNDLNWSSGVSVNCTPVIAYCTAASTNTSYEFIEGVEFNTINNVTSATTYSDYYPTISTTVIKGETYPLTVYNGDYYTSDILLGWIDWNQDGDFADAGEQVVTTISGASAPYTVNITIPTGAGATVGSTRMRLRLYDSGVGTPNATPCGTHTYGEVEDYQLIIVEPCIPTHTFTSFTPTSGPEGTYVTINGTGFSASTTVSFNNIASTDIEFISSTQIIARVPAGNTTGLVRVTESSCPIKSGANFTKIDKSGSCTAASSYSDLIISEVYDADANNVAYIELYNPTASPINLATANYSIGIDNNTTTSPVTIDRTINLTGIVPAGGVFLCNLGTSANTCNKTWDFSAGGGGWNANDNLFLIKNGTQIDRVNTPSNTGYSILRKALASGPTTSFNAADWTINNTEDCADLGVAPVNTYNNPTTVVTNTPGCSVNMSVAVTEGNATPSGDLTYKWYYSDGTAVGWTQVTALVPAGYTITGNTTNQLTITTNTKDIYLLDKYQFYCEVTEAGTCKNVSIANKFRVNSRPVYRSVAASNGNWTTVANWEMANTTAGPWVAACTYPNSLNSSEAIIQSGTYIILDIDNDIDRLTVEATATLEILTNSQLTIYDSTAAGADFILNGTLYYRANSANSIVFNDPVGPLKTTWTFGSGATIIKTASASADDFKTYYEGGMSTIPSLGKFIYRYNGDGNPVTAAAGFYYPDLYFENTANTGLFDFNNSLMQLSGNANGFCTVKGNMFVGTTGTGKVKVYNNNVNATPHTIVGNLEIGTGSTFTNALCSGCGAANSTSDAGTGVNLGGNLVNAGVLDINSLNGSAVNTGILRFNGTGTQTVSGVGVFDLWNVELNKTAQTLVDQQVNLTANNNLNFVGGILKTSNNVFTVANGSTTNAVTGFETPYTGTSTPAYVNDRYVWGYLERLVNTNGMYVYPIGDNLTGEAYNPLRFSVNGGTGASTYATANFIPGDPGSCVAGPIYFSCNGERNFLQYSDMTSEGKWRMSSSSSTTFNYDIYLHPNQNNLNISPNEEVTDYPLFYKNNYRALKAPNGTTDWSPYVLLGDKCIVGSYYNIPGVGYSGFSDFAPGGGSGSTTALPVELTSFTASCKDNQVEVRWSTATEFNSSYFILERSLDAAHFETVAYVQAAGNSNTAKQYSVIDTSTVYNSYYYRLTEVDQDGKRIIYSLVYVRCREVNGWNAFPTPDGVVIEATSNTNKDVQIRMYEMSGKLLLQEKRVVQRGYNRFNIEVPTLAKGVYVIQMISGENAESVKVWMP